jgi:hypothetical protein
MTADGFLIGLGPGGVVMQALDEPEQVDELGAGRGLGLFSVKGRRDEQGEEEGEEERLHGAL